MMTGKVIKVVVTFDDLWGVLSKKEKIDFLREKICKLNQKEFESFILALNKEGAISDIISLEDENH